jgi:hypothetical protein
MEGGGTGWYVIVKKAPAAVSLISVSNPRSAAETVGAALSGLEAAVECVLAGVDSPARHRATNTPPPSTAALRNS